MEVHHLSQQHSLLNYFIAQIRDVQTHSNLAIFRRNLERIGEITALEISRTLTYSPRVIETPLASIEQFYPPQEVVVGTNPVPAGLPFQQGFLNYFDYAASAFVYDYRKFTPNHDDMLTGAQYLACPDLSNKILILTDTMLATGLSIEKAIRNLIKNGMPKEIHIASVIASEQGVSYLQNNCTDIHIPTTLWCGAIDPSLNDRLYIVPGIGDAGDLAFGSKLQ